MSFIKLENLSVEVENKKVIFDLSLEVKSSEISVLMGPNGSGKSSLLYALTDHPRYKILSGDFFLNQINVTKMSTYQRARQGLFFIPQHLPSFSDISLLKILEESFYLLNPYLLSNEFCNRINFAQEILKISNEILNKGLNDDISGGEKKRCEILQMLVLQPNYILIDEIDSGLDVDSIKLVANAIIEFKKIKKEASILLITHYARILNYLNFDSVLILKSGSIVAKGDKNLIDDIESSGYEKF